MKQYAELIYHSVDKQWKLYMNDSTGVLDIEASGLEFRKALNEASKHGWDLVSAVENMQGNRVYLVARETPENPLSEDLLGQTTKELIDRYKLLEKKFEDLKKVSEFTHNVSIATIKEKDNIIKAILLDGGDAISTTGEFDGTFSKVDLDSFDLTCKVKDEYNKLKMSVWIEELDTEEDGEA